VTRLAVLTDYPDEGWPSMDLCGDMLLAHLRGVEAERVCPPFRRVFGRLPRVGRKNAAFNADRLLNRFALFPRAIRGLRGRFDAFHVVDHTYSQLLLALPAGRAGVYCHDLDAFRCLIEPARDPRPRWFRALAGRILAGFRRAAVVFHNTRAVGDELLRWNLVDPNRLIHAPLAPAPEFAPDGPAEPGSYLLHVGSCIPRKRIDVLLGVYERVRAKRPGVALVQAGGRFDPAQREWADRLGVRQVRDLTRGQLAALYRGAAAVLVPSEAEGFGLPVLEALACGAPVVASDIPALREVGGPAVAFRPVADLPAWEEAVLREVDAGRGEAAERLAWAGRFSWAKHAEIIAGAYVKLAGG
jgi:glycosyltransferase involved in cell wall biosynthesis